MNSEALHVLKLVAKTSEQFYIPGDELLGTDVITHSTKTTYDIPVHRKTYIMIIFVTWIATNLFMNKFKKNILPKAEMNSKIVIKIFGHNSNLYKCSLILHL